MTDSEYYFEKAEFQDPVAHAKHFNNYRNGIHSSVAFDEAYTREVVAYDILIEFAANNRLHFSYFYNKVCNGWVYQFKNPRTDYFWAYAINHVLLEDSTMTGEYLAQAIIDRIPKELFTN